MKKKEEKGRKRKKKEEKGRKRKKKEEKGRKRRTFSSFFYLFKL